MRSIIIRSFNGIGDLLFITPSLTLIKKVDPNLHIHINTFHPQLLEANPFVSSVGSKREGFFINYPDPWSGKNPTQHHIQSARDLLVDHYQFNLGFPELKPLLYINQLIPKIDKILVQVIHKRQWGAKKVWPYFEQLSRIDGFRRIPKLSNERELVRTIMAAPAVVCAEGGISHIAKAVGTPAVVVYGGWAKPEWNGYSDQENIVVDLECSPCYNRNPCKHRMKCMDNIPLDMVIEATGRLIGRKL